MRSGPEAREERAPSSALFMEASQDAARPSAYVASTAAKFWDRLDLLTYEHPIRSVYGGAIDYLASCSPTLRRAILEATPAEYGSLRDWPRIMREDGADAETVEEADRKVDAILNPPAAAPRPNA
jgi:hypothetical protein